MFDTILFSCRDLVAMLVFLLHLVCFPLQAMRNGIPWIPNISPECEWIAEKFIWRAQFNRSDSSLHLFFDEMEGALAFSTGCDLFHLQQ